MYMLRSFTLFLSLTCTQVFFELPVEEDDYLNVGAEWGIEI